MVVEELGGWGKCVVGGSEEHVVVISSVDDHSIGKIEWRVWMVLLLQVEKAEVGSK